MYDGLINVYKEKGFTSHDVVAKLRGICKQKKIGHTGTLDPDAVGVLPVCLGTATKVCDMLTDRDKEYIARLRLGITTDTQDLTGKVLSQGEIRVSAEEAAQVICGFRGEQQQIPPMYSALKVNGKKLYELARQGKEVERSPRPVTVHEIEILEEDIPEFTIRVRCSKGTYIRTLCHDIGQRLGCGAAMASLIRSRAGEFAVEDSRTLGQLQELADQGRLMEAVVPVERLFEELPSATAKESAQKALQNGNRLAESQLAEQVRESRMRMYSHEGRFYGIYGYEEASKLYCPVKLFISEQE